MFHYLVVTKVTELLESDADILHYLMVNKLMYSFRNSIRFVRFPIEYFQENYEENRLERFVPLKFREVTFHNNEQYELYITMLFNSLNIQSIRFGRNFIDYLDFHDGWLMKNVDTIRLGFHFDQMIKPGYIPDSVVFLKFGYWFNSQIFPGALGDTIETLKFGTVFDQSLTNILPKNLKYLRVKGKYNQPMEKGLLPPSLRTLILGENFNQPLSIEVNLPLKLTTLIVGYDFNQDFKIGDLPETLETLKFGYSFKRPLKAGVLPVSLKNLSFVDYVYSLHGKLPPLLQYLSFVYYKHDIVEGTLPNSLVEFHSSRCEIKCKLPSKLKILTLPSFYNIFKGQLPSGLISLAINQGTELYEKNLIPSTVTTLSFGIGYTSKVAENIIPHTVNIIKVDNQNILKFFDKYAIQRHVKVIKSNNSKRYSNNIQYSQLKEVVQCLLHSILFQRALGAIKPKDVVLDCTEYSFSKVDDISISKAVEEKSEELLTTIMKKQLKNAQIAISFYEKRDKTSFLNLTSTSENVCWEQWIITFNLVSQMDPKTLLSQIQDTVFNIIEKVNQDKNIPPIKSATESTPFPFEIVIPGSENPGMVNKVWSIFKPPPILR
ncbi:DUF1649 family protein [Tieghemostelium lacteum]|uniref:DUF1649 family protein n=1 Tax=Tieghemostelium lacteum TaxID=361077 RepID=A0A151ZFP0_TIELA|nr:DUF1649 family protein [Tieghemostelium lacteum]|eukprot:KYQ92729.1 DUF1649 family protein [Tieghemostelium lacteum]